MNANVLITVLVTGLSLFWALNAQAQFTALDDATLARGEVVAYIIQQRGPGGRLVAAIDIPTPARVVWKVLLDCERAPAYVTGLMQCRILETARDGRSDTREHRLTWLSILPTVSLRFRSDYVDEREIRVTRMSGDLAAMSGVWRLEPRENGQMTRLHYDFTLVPNTLLPSGLVRSGLLRDTPKVLKSVRSEAIRVARQ